MVGAARHGPSREVGRCAEGSCWAVVGSSGRPGCSVRRRRHRRLRSRPPGLRRDRRDVRRCLPGRDDRLGRRGPRSVRPPARAPPLPGQPAHADRGGFAAGPASLDNVIATIDEVTPAGTRRADKGVLLTGFDLDAGTRALFGGPGTPHLPDVGLGEAVRASCAIPGWFEPVSSGGRRFVDGGSWSVSNADAAVGHHLDEVVVLAPMVSFDPARRCAARPQRRPGSTARGVGPRPAASWPRLRPSVPTAPSSGLSGRAEPTSPYGPQPDGRAPSRRRTRPVPADIARRLARPAGAGELGRGARPLTPRQARLRQERTVSGGSCPDVGNKWTPIEETSRPCACTCRSPSLRSREPWKPASWAPRRCSASR